VNKPCNFPKVNYLLNKQRDRSYTCNGFDLSDITWQDWQRVFWELIHGHTDCACGAPNYQQDVVDCLIADANAHANWYPSKCTDVFAAILIPLPDCTCNITIKPTDQQSTAQEILIPVTLADWGCACVTETEDTVAMAFGGDCPTQKPCPVAGNNCIIPKSQWKPYFEYCCTEVQ